MSGMLIEELLIKCVIYVDFLFFSLPRCRFGEIPGFPVGSRWDGRRELCDAGVHAHLSGGIHGRGEEGAFSIVLCVAIVSLPTPYCVSNGIIYSPLNRSGGYEDDVDEGYQL